MCGIATHLNVWAYLSCGYVRTSNLRVGYWRAFACECVGRDVGA